MSEVTHFNPADISFSNEDILNEASETRLREGWYKWMVTRGKLWVAGPDHARHGMIAVMATVNALKSDSSLVYPNQSLFLALPIKNPNAPNYVPEFTAAFKEFCSACDIERFGLPVKRGAGWELDGQPFDGSAVSQRSALVARERLNFAAELVTCGDEALSSKLRGAVFYGRLSYKADKKDVVRANINNLCSALPFNAQLVSDDSMVETVRPDISVLEAAASEPKGKKGKK